MQWLLGLITGPIFNTLLNGWKMKLDAANSAGAQAVEVAQAAMTAEVQARAEANKVNIALLGKWYLALPMVMTMGAAAAYFVKCVVWDSMLGWGETPKLGGDIQVTYNLIMSFWFGTAAIKGAIVAARTWWR